MNKTKVALSVLAILLCASTTFAQQDNHDLRRAIESLKSAVNQLQAAVAQLEKSVVDEAAPAPVVSIPAGDQFVSVPGRLGPSAMVFVSSDSYYHREACAKISPNAIQMAHSRAHDSYFTCTACKPDTDGPFSYARGPLAQPPVEILAGQKVYINYGELQYHFPGCPRIKLSGSFERTLEQAKVPFMRCMTCSKLETVVVSPSDSGGGSVADGSSATTTGQHKTLAPVNTSGTVQVKGYYRKDGTYVRPHTRSAPGTKKKGG